MVLEFDHLGDKLFDIGQALPYRRWQTILDEIAKCEVVCANCHRRRTARARGHCVPSSQKRDALIQRAGGGNRTRLRELGRLLCSRYTTPAAVAT